MGNSLTDMKLVSEELLRERLTSVKVLKEDELEAYEIMKDAQTGEHYLHYAYFHKNIAAGGTEESFNQLMPLDSDDVLALVLGEQGYAYPDHWPKRFLRNGPLGQYVWFNPIETEKVQGDAQFTKRLVDRLFEFKQTGKLDEASMLKLFEDIDKMNGK